MLAYLTQSYPCKITLFGLCAFFIGAIGAPVILPTLVLTLAGKAFYTHFLAL